MKFNSLIAVAMILTLSASLDANAFFKFRQCRQEAIIDVRGNTFDTDGDGKTTILETALANPLDNLDTLGVAVGLADPLVADALGDASARWTVFAPDNEAFEAIPTPLFDAITSDQAIVTNVLLYHVIVGRSDPRRVPFFRKRNSLLGQDLFITRGRENPAINNSQISCTGVRTDNGNVWIIDSVLQPQGLVGES